MTYLAPPADNDLVVDRFRLAAVHDSVTVKADSVLSEQGLVVRQVLGQNVVLRARADGVVNVQEAELLQNRAKCAAGM